MWWQNQLQSVIQHVSNFGAFVVAPIAIIVGCIALAWFYPVARSIAITIALIVGALMGGFWVGHHKGRVDLLTTIERVNSAAINRARQGATNAADCDNMGWIWDQTTGKCMEPKP